MEEKKEWTPEEASAPQEKELSQEERRVLKEMDREEMDDMDRKADSVLGADEWIHAEYIVDYDSALEGLNLAARLKLGAQRGLQTIALGIVACWFAWPAISESEGKDPLLLVTALVIIAICLYGMYAVWHFPKKHRFQNAKKMEEAKTPCTIEVFYDHVAVREGEETTVLEYDNKTFQCYNSDHVLLLTYNRLDIIIIPKDQLGEELDRICEILKAKLMSNYKIKGKQEEKPFDRWKRKLGFDKEK